MFPGRFFEGIESGTVECMPGFLLRDSGCAEGEESTEEGSE